MKPFSDATKWTASHTRPEFHCQRQTSGSQLKDCQRTGEATEKPLLLLVLLGYFLRNKDGNFIRIVDLNIIYVGSPGWHTPSLQYLAPGVAVSYISNLAS